MDKAALAETAYESAAPIARFVGHALAVAVGPVALTAILIIPILLVRTLVWAGFPELGSAMHAVEVGLLYVDLRFFGLTLLIGALELLLVETARSFKRMKSAFM